MYTKVTFCGEQTSQTRGVAEGGAALWNSGAADHFLKTCGAEPCGLQPHRRARWRCRRDLGGGGNRPRYSKGVL